MRLLICCEQYSPSVGGVQKVMQEIAERLSRRGHDVTVATTKLENRNFKSLNNVKIKEFSISGNLVKGLKGEIENYRQFVLNGGFNTILVKAAQQWTFDGLLSILEKIKSRKVHIPCGYSDLYNPDYEKYYNELMPSVLSKFDHLIYYSNNYRDIDFAKKYGISKFSVIPNGASEDEFAVPQRKYIRRKFELDNECFIYLTVGSPPFMKGHLEIAQAYSIANLPFSSCLILNGEYGIAENPNCWSYFQKINVLCRQLFKGLLGLPQNKKYLFSKAISDIKKQSRKKIIIANLARNDLISIFFESDLFIFSSHIEYSPLVLYESAAAGLPFITIPVGNAEEIAKSTGGGEICPAEMNERGLMIVNPSILAEKMAMIAENKAHLNTLGKIARANWKKKFTWEKIVIEYERILINEDSMRQ